MYRQSLAEQFTSHQRALLTGQWTIRQAPRGAPPAIRVKPADLLKFCAEVRQYYQQALDLDWIEDRALVVSYEELTANVARLFATDICPFLGVPFAELKSSLHKQNTRPLSEIVENYDQVQALMQSDVCRQQYGFQGRPSERAA